MPRPEALLLARAKQFGLPLATLSNRLLRPDQHQDLESVVPEEFARRHSALPLFLDRELLAVALSDPSEETLAALRALTGLKLQPFLAKPEELALALERFYGRAD